MSTEVAAHHAAHEILGSTRFWTVIVGKVKMGNTAFKSRQCNCSGRFIRRKASKVMPHAQTNFWQQHNALPASSVLHFQCFDG